MRVTASSLPLPPIDPQCTTSAWKCGTTSRPRSSRPVRLELFFSTADANSPRTSETVATPTTRCGRTPRPSIDACANGPLRGASSLSSFIARVRDLRAAMDAPPLFGSKHPHMLNPLARICRVEGGYARPDLPRLVRGSRRRVPLA